MLSVSTITPVRNDATAVARAIACIRAQSAPVEHIVIAVGPSDDGSKEAVLELAGGDPRILVVDNPSGRTPTGLNLAIAECRSDVVLRIDARSFVDTKYVENAVEALVATGAGNVGAVQVPVGVSAVQRGIAAAMQSPLGSGGAAYRSSGPRQRVDTAWLGAFRREALIAVGGYDEEFIRNQDAELNLRLDRAGYEVWVDPALAVEYRPRDSLRKLATQYYEYGWWRLRTGLKHRGSLRPRQLAAPLLVFGLGLSVCGAVVIRPALLLVPLTYALLLVAGAARMDASLRVRVIGALALAIMHVSWGLGFIASMVGYGLNSLLLRLR